MTSVILYGTNFYFMQLSIESFTMHLSMQVNLNEDIPIPRLIQ